MPNLLRYKFWPIMKRLNQRLRNRRQVPFLGGDQIFVADQTTLERVASEYQKLPFGARLEQAPGVKSSGVAKDVEDLRRAFRELLGCLPVRDSLSPLSLATWDCGDYVREKICFRGSASYLIPAYVLVPKNRECPPPAVIAIHGHSPDLVWGKTSVCAFERENATYGYCVALVQQGYVVIAIDLLGFEERQLTSVQETTPWRQDMERLIFGNSLLQGATLAGLNLFDLSRAVDYLCERMDIVDSKHIGVIGHSMGGTLAPLLMLFDDRIRVGISSAGLSTWRAMMAHQVIHNYAVYIPGLLQVADLDALCSLIAPRPFLMIAGKQDPNFPLEGVRDVERAMRDRYQEYGRPEAFAALIHPGGHSFEPDQQTRAITFLDRWLQNDEVSS